MRANYCVVLYFEWHRHSYIVFFLVLPAWYRYALLPPPLRPCPVSRSAVSAGCQGARLGSTAARTSGDNISREQQGQSVDVEPPTEQRTKSGENHVSQTTNQRTKGTRTRSRSRSRERHETRGRHRQQPNARVQECRQFTK